MSNENTGDKKNYPVRITGMWYSPYGELYRVVGDEEFDNLQKIVKGGILKIKFMADEQRKSDKSPNAFLEFVTPEQRVASGNKARARVTPKQETSEAKEPDAL